MNKCSVCGYLNRDDKDFCDDCGICMFKDGEDLREWEDE